MTVTITPFLRNALLIDAAVSGAAGVLMVGGSGLLAPLLTLPQPLLFWAGIVIFAWTALLVAVSRRASASRLMLVDIVAGNALWVAASIGILIGGLVAPNLLGTLFVVAQALAVALFAALQAAGLRSAAAAHA